jgi:hypothetical protein
MTDREMALAIGTLLIRREIRNAALVAELEMYRSNPGWEKLPWRANVQKTIDSPESAHGADMHIAELKNALDAAKPDESLVHILHQMFLQD